MNCESWLFCLCWLIKLLYHFGATRGEFFVAVGIRDLVAKSPDWEIPSPKCETCVVVRHSILRISKINNLCACMWLAGSFPRRRKSHRLPKIIFGARLPRPVIISLLPALGERLDIHHIMLRPL